METVPLARSVAIAGHAMPGEISFTDFLRWENFRRSCGFRGRPLAFHRREYWSKSEVFPHYPQMRALIVPNHPEIVPTLSARMTRILVSRFADEIPWLWSYRASEKRTSGSQEARLRFFHAAFSKRFLPFPFLDLLSFGGNVASKFNSVKLWRMLRNCKILPEAEGG